MRTWRSIALGALIGACLLSTSGTVGADEIIRLRPAAPEASDLDDPAAEALSGPRRGFDYQEFEARLESLWFQRKALLADGRDADASRQSQLIRAFCAEEGVQRLENVSASLVTEAGRFLEQGHHARALDSLDLAAALDPRRPQVHLARAEVYRQSDRGAVAAAGEVLSGLRAGAIRSLQELTLFNRVGVVLVVASILLALAFSVLMVLRYQVPFRHEVEEWVGGLLHERWSVPAGWAALFLPVLTWVGAGWLALYWILICFRFMSRRERLVAAGLLLLTALTVPAHRAAVSMYGMTVDPVVRTTLVSAGGEYDPDRILKLRQLVASHPDDPVYRFLLAGLYKNGRYFEDAFAEYKEALEIDPAMEQAYINIGNIFYTTGQHGEAIAHYRKALEIAPGTILAYFNLHLAQSESFRFKQAEETLAEARARDPEGLADLFAVAGAGGQRPTVVDATLRMASVWEAAFGVGGSGGPPRTTDRAREAGFGTTGDWVNPLSVVALGVLVSAGLGLIVTRRHRPASRCHRCGRPSCRLCRSGRDASDYCSQCQHLFVLGDGLAPETKSQKLYEVDRFERRKRWTRRAVGFLVPGAGRVLAGRTLSGVAILGAWLACLIAARPAVLQPIERLTGSRFGLEMLAPGTVPDAFSLDTFAVLATIACVVVWLTVNVGPRRWRELQG